MTLREGMLLGIGNPLVDITVHIDDAFLQRHDIKHNESVRGDITGKIALLQELDTLPGVQRTAGGSGLNVIRAAQWVVKAPRTCTFVGCIGNDENGVFVRRSCEKAGVRMVCQTVDCPTSVCAVLVTGADRSMCSFQNASGRFDFRRFLERDAEEVFQQANVVYLSGFFLNVCLITAEYVAKKAVETGKKFVFDLGAPRVVKGQAETMKRLLPFTDVIFGNDAEMSALGEILELPVQDPTEICLRVANSSTHTPDKKRAVVMTRGKDPVILATNGQIFNFQCRPVPVEEIVDVNGAGDGFLGGFLAEYMQNSPLPVCISSGLSVSDTVIRHTGCSFAG